MNLVINCVLTVMRRFIRHDRGNMSLILGLCLAPLMVCAGVAVDYVRALNARTQLIAALDTATLYAAAYSANNASATDASLTTISKAYVTQNYENAGDAQITSFSVKNGTTSITSTASIKLTTYFMAVGGYTTMNLNASSTVLKSGINLEVALVLDNTNSMNSINAKTGNSAITDLKAAAQKFITTVMPATQGTYYTKIALVPYNNSVNMGTAVMAAAARGAVQSGTSNNGVGKAFQQFNTSSTYKASYSSSCDNYSNNSNNVCQETLPVTNCVTERTGATAYTDASMSVYPVGWNYAGSANGCTVTPVIPLSTSATILNTAITTMAASNSTAGQVGLAWGWYALSPNVGIWSGSSIPAGYDKLTTTDPATKVRKVMVIMTDGEYNSAYCKGVITGYDTTNGSSGNPYYWSVVGSGDPSQHIGCAPTNGDSYTQSAAMCGAAQDAGIEIYVITFQLNKSYQKRVDLVNNCATDSSHIIDADSTSLDAAFSSLANQILAMRISS
ncbi:TadE/TadG family type IV pilus assembly protein [Aestuariivirga litoralis]|uniref:TadE/TadG family type IV pilus assembly protein n=1 Tax=Aestuariivirga litoralis TaxID=2650924 RepID=UPI0018C52449|nr:pilus assembly protein TadG-related protein [Aestuariivirga litoralis]MBG1233102.1 hypothetical protein [Aestuariivirga litoralis]